MTLEESKQAIEEYNDYCQRVRIMARNFSRVLPGNLKRFTLDSNVLDDLKRELKDWDALRHCWKK